MDAAAHFLRGDQGPHSFLETTRFSSCSASCCARSPPRGPAAGIRRPGRRSAVERVVDEQELHHPVLRLLGVERVRPDLHAFGGRRGAAGNRLGAFSTSTRHMRQLAAMVSLRW
jgi:hypothetical protein